MKKIIMAKDIGFCFGVRRAVKMTEKILEKNKNLVSIGDIVHNPVVMEKLIKKGLKVCKEEKEIKKGPFIIRSHGLSPSKIKKLEGKGIEIYDATCPYVKKVHHLIEKLDRENFLIIIIGNRFHPEVMALKEYGDNVFVFDGEGIDFKKKFEKVAIIGQTTLSFKKYFEFVEYLVEKIESKQIRVYNTICKVTENRQKQAKEISRKVDSVFVLGGKNSSNTTKLYELCKLRNKKSFHIEKMGEFDKIDIHKFNSIGIVSGTSTPEEFIKDVIEYLKKNNFKEVE